MAVPEQFEFFIDPNRCIGCQSCVQACGECETHKGTPMIHLEYIDRAESVQTVPVVCMHCDSPTCAEVCPADAIKRTGDGVVQSARKPRCIACGNCVYACPFGVPKIDLEKQLMMKCDMCYDRSSVGKKPMCATVCPSQALFYGTREEIERLRPKSAPMNTFQFGRQTITTKVNLMVPRDGAVRYLDVLSAMHDEPPGKRVALTILAADPLHMCEGSMKRDPEQVSIPPDGRPLSVQPAWRQDFPIDMPQDNYIVRRDFTKFIVLTSGAFVVGQVCIAAKAMWSRQESAARKIGSLQDVAVGEAMTFAYPGEHDDCILLRTAENTVVGYSQKCTHLWCAVVPDPHHHCLHCPCHEGNFDIATGRPISGPPRRPLPRILVELRGTEIWATGVEERMV